MASTATVYTWAVNNLERTLSDGVVFTVHYTVTAESGEYVSSSYGSVGLDAPSEDHTFIEYADLTEAVVIDWIKDLLDVSAIEASLQVIIDNEKSPVEAVGIPWS